MPELASSERLAAIARSDLYAGVPEPTLEPFARIVARLLDVPVALISIVTDDRQFFPAAVGLDEPWRSRGETPLSMSFCQHVVVGDAPLVVVDAPRDDRVADNGAITELDVVVDAPQDDRVAGNGAVTELDVVAYLGVPLRAPDGQALGSVCAIDHRPREWTDGDLELLQEVAQAAAQAISLRTSEHLWAEFAAEASHHLRTPVAAMQLELEDLAAWSSLDPEVRDVVEAAVGHVGDLSRVVDDLTEVAHTRRRLGERPVDLGQLARSLGDEVVVDGAEPVTVTTYPSVLRHALHELVRLLDRPVRIAVEGLAGAWRVRVASVDPLRHELAPVPLSLAELVRSQLGGRVSADPTAGAYELVLPAS